MNTGLKGRAPVFQSGLDLELDRQPGPPARHDYSSRNICNKSRISTTVILRGNPPASLELTWMPLGFFGTDRITFRY